MQSFFLVRACQMQRSQPLSVVPCRQLSISATVHTTSCLRMYRMIPRMIAVCILLKSIDSRLYQQNEDMKKAIDQLVVLNSALVELQNEIKVCSSCMTAMLDALNELKSKNSQQAEQETTPTKYPGKNFANWGEVIRRVEVYGDKFIADNLRGTKASLDGVTLYLACTPSTKKFLKSSAVAIPRIKQQCRNVIGYGVEVKIIDL